ncbi:hypothetical protein SUGI_0973940 [Cryptomeria japonica]|uniref:uncharacterized protein LOC131073927 n=1 Tax=Cryptomeria japonica TaxID=3369 RepID=UPI002414ABFE|nr:uncharacterized protein LOC131073927 [Cryptomeria japonica]GLJ46230.1 hypothetical protein SUGI_0973940 [Cryptomeria japonica]
MASRATAHWRSILSRYQNARLISTSTQFKMQPHASAHGGAVAAAGSLRTFKTDYIPIYTLFGMILLAVSLGTLNVKHELVHCPSVFVNKKKRKTVPEVENSELVMQKSEDFVNKSIFRKLGQREFQIMKPMP